jgi:urea carboxylase
LLSHREDFLEGKFSLRIEEETFRLHDYHAFLSRIGPEAAAFKANQQTAFEAERERWAATEFILTDETEATSIQEEVPLPSNGSFIDSPIAGNLWKLLVKVGDPIAVNQPVAIVESMKMEMQICATRAGTIQSVLCSESSPVSPGQHLFIIETAA